MILDEQFARRVKRYRRFHLMNRTDFAAACRARGAPPNFTAAAVTNIENGRPRSEKPRTREIGLQEAQIIADTFGVSLVDMIREAQEEDLV
ncbi:helix-turn-helix domain-containing protein [Actinopolyspora halophila]|uniref:helix-turn-helix domain-containing protein n=1 Tax=Actinopolyspora halophila TaxID=1850 RepID=UPI0003659C1E|nr:helix-turn-helix transcriptional regulator [Actinopolyspora halophila]